MGIGKFSSVHRENRENAACLNVNGGQAKLNWNWNDNANPNYGSASRGCVIFSGNVRFLTRAFLLKRPFPSAEHLADFL